MHRIFLLSVLAFAVLSLSSVVAQEASGIQFFSGTLKEAIAKGKAEHKAIFLDAHASWCGPCKTMEREVFVRPEVAAYFNQKYVSVRIDMEKGEGPDLAKKLTSIDGYPSLLFFDSEGHLAKTLLGNREAEDFLHEAKLVAK